jgi:hypothetical protein
MSRNGPAGPRALVAHCMSHHGGPVILDSLDRYDTMRFNSLKSNSGISFFLSGMLGSSYQYSSMCLCNSMVDFRRNTTDLLPQRKRFPSLRQCFWNVSKWWRTKIQLSISRETWSYTIASIPAFFVNIRPIQKKLLISRQPYYSVYFFALFIYIFLYSLR